jgi:hypothetical protein
VFLRRRQALPPDITKKEARTGAFCSTSIANQSLHLCFINKLALFLCLLRQQYLDD